MWGPQCTHRGQSQEGQEESGWGIWFHWTVFFLHVCSGCCATMFLRNPSQETWTFLKHHCQKGSRLSSYSLLPVVPTSGQQGEFSGVWGRVLRSQHSCSGLWELSSRFPRNPKCLLKSWEVFLPGKLYCHKDLSQNYWESLGVLVLVGLFFFVWVHGFFKTSVYYIDWMLLYFLPAQKILVERDAV